MYVCVCMYAGVSTSFEVGGWKTKVDGSDEARARRRCGTRGVRGHVPMGNFLKFGVSLMHFPGFSPRNYDS